MSRAYSDITFTPSVQAMQTRMGSRSAYARLSYGNENWEFDANGFMAVRHASINDLGIAESDRKFRWALGRRPDDHTGLGELGL